MLTVEGERTEARICWRRREDHQVELSVYWPTARRETRSNFLVPVSHLIEMTLDLKATLERSYNRVWVKGYLD